MCGDLGECVGAWVYVGTCHHVWGQGDVCGDLGCVCWDLVVCMWGPRGVGMELGECAGHVCVYGDLGVFVGIWERVGGHGKIEI